MNSRVKERGKGTRKKNGKKIQKYSELIPLYNNFPFNKVVNKRVCKIVKILYTFVPLCLCAFVPSSILFGQDLTANEIIKKANDVINQKTVFGKMKMTIVTTSGKKRELFYDFRSKNRGEKNLNKYTAPRRIMGQAFLMLNNADDIWMYNPRTNRVRKLATHAKKQKIQGSDFSYEDMGSGDSFIEDFNHKLMPDEKKEGHDCYVVEMTIKEGRDSNYSRMIAWIDKKNYLIRVIDYYDEKNRELLKKTLIQSDLKIIDGVPTAMKMTMYNRMDNTKTENEVLEIKYNIRIDDNIFTERGLKK